MPKLPDLIEIQTLHREMSTSPPPRGLICKESASSSPPSSSSPNRYSRRSELPRILNISYRSMDSPVRISSRAQHNASSILKRRHLPPRIVRFRRHHHHRFPLLLDHKFPPPPPPPPLSKVWDSPRTPTPLAFRSPFPNHPPQLRLWDRLLSGSPL
ncbi:hypothetical protein Salat_1821300 [Sesamum alatum]|uniref:Uncharacterized protein n=1 Tax=Sesamum alatum TaxID=300844 RepID=A0AAE2CHK0_9LAMI|nr:hypothetical protein Salat_1821300 [Sesamum alatum]